MVSAFDEFRLGVADFLNTDIINNYFIYVDYYTFIHIITGFIIMFLIYKIFKRAKKTNEKFVILVLIAVLWELFEFAFIASGSKLFRRDSIINVVWDMIAGMFGGSIYWYFRKKDN